MCLAQEPTTVRSPKTLDGPGKQIQCALSAVTTKGSMESVAAGDVKECTKQSEASDAVASAPRVSFLSASRVPEDEDPVLMSMCKLLTSLLRIPAAGVGMLNRGKLQYFGIQHPAQWQSLPNLAAVPLDEELLIIKDTQMDCRYSELEKQAGIRFYACAPLLSSKKHRVGALLVMDTKPREEGFSPETTRIFMDMVRIMSSKMEADYKKAVEAEQQNRTKEQLLQSLDKIRSPISVCEITREATKILFANHTWAFLAGLGNQAIVNCNLWDLFVCVDETKEEAQARFWACEVGKRDFTSCFILADKGDEPQMTMRLHFRSANRGVPKAAARVPKGMLSQAVAKALQPSFFFAMFDDDVQEFIPADAMRSRTSMQASRTASSILDLDDDAVMEASVQAGHTRRSSASVTPVQALPHVLESSADPRARAGKADGSSPAKVNGTHKNGKPVAKQGCCTIS
ncbi:hypothetical protein WJX75_005984 [Coccomyxa subellipsoidea]|uniref:GAF domain-containing protein n=1 Tax=Coccomyxa subellipsoidea TaxID=248742 RepID=A0ABR2YNG0_9CHLO